MKLVQTYIDNWIREQAFLQQAETNLSSDEIDDINNQVHDYRYSLLSFLYENHLVSEKVDTLVTQTELRDAYESAGQELALEEPLYQIIFLETITGNSKEDSIAMWLNDFVETENDASLRQFCALEAVLCHLAADEWIGETTLKETLRLENGISFSNYGLNAVRKVSGNNDNSIYFKIFNKQTNGKAPFEFVRKDIENRIKRKRKTAFLQEIREAMYNSALHANEIEVYD